MTVDSCKSQALRGTLLLASLLILGACTTTETPERFDAVAPARLMAQGDECPDLSGFWRFDGAQPVLQYFTEGAPSGFAPTVLNIDAEPGTISYPMNMGVATDQALAAANALLARDPDGYAAWRTKNLAQAAAHEAQQSTDSLEREIAAIGPLLRRDTMISRGRCDAYWTRVAELPPAQYANAFGHSGDEYELELWLGRDVSGALLLRFDRYRMRSSWLMAKPLRTFRAQYFYRLPSAVGEVRLFAARNSTLPAPKPPEPVFDPSARADALVALSERIQGTLPANMIIESFEPRIEASDAQRHMPVITLDIKGTAASNADISRFMRQLDSDEAMSRLELISVRADEGRMHFELQVDWAADATTP